MKHNNPEKILQLGLGFWGSKVLLSAVELGLFTELAKGPMTGSELRDRLKLHSRSYLDFFDALVALGLLQRENGKYSNSEDSDFYLDKNKPSYVGGILEMANARLYRFWDRLTEALRTGEPQNEAKAGEDMFAILYSDPARLKGFLQAMTGLSQASGKAIAEKFPWEKYKSFVDVGAAQGGVVVPVARTHGHLQGAGFDLPAVGPIFSDYIRSHGLESRIKFIPGDFMKDALPPTDVIIMGHILHDWDLATKKMLLAKAFQALHPGGAIIIHEAIIDNERTQNTFGLLMSLNMLIETPGGFDYTAKDCMEWIHATGFRDMTCIPLLGPDSMVIGYKK